MTGCDTIIFLKSTALHGVYYKIVMKYSPKAKDSRHFEHGIHNLKIEIFITVFKKVCQLQGPTMGQLNAAHNLTKNFFKEVFLILSPHPKHFPSEFQLHFSEDLSYIHTD